MSTKLSKLERRIRNESIRLKSQYFVDMLQLLRERHGIEFVIGPTIKIKNARESISIPEQIYAEPGVQIVQYTTSGLSYATYRVETVARLGENEFSMTISFSDSSANLVIGREIEFPAGFIHQYIIIYIFM